LDCCYSGGMARAGGARVRGLTPPDDIRHRALEWDARDRAWRERDLVNERAKSAMPSPRRLKRFYGGEDGSVRRLGTAARLRWVQDARYRASRKRYRHKGPYMPVLLSGCSEGQLSYEYREGTASYGAFTFLMTQSLRQHGRRGGRQLTF